jgi:hypothetical protein
MPPPVTRAETAEPAVGRGESATPYVSRVDVAEPPVRRVPLDTAFRADAAQPIAPPEAPAALNAYGYLSTSAALPELAQLAAAVRAPAPLVWLRVRRGQRLEATLRPDGLIQLADGALFADPDLAAARAAQAEGLVDGWRMWRLGDGGLTLAEVTGR